MYCPRSALLALAAFLVVLGGVSADTLAQETPECPPGRSVSPDTAGRCCWPGQAWSGEECVGKPTSCPEGMAYTEDGQACELVPCSEGQVRTADGVHCCWPGQGWSSARNACVGEPECEEGYVVEDGGCTPGPTLLDTDQDLLVDAEDECRDDPEDADGFEDDDGCPDPDNDGDSVPDVDDGCPLKAEDVDNHRDEDGCPDPDNDNDGLADSEDSCPDRPESRANRGKPSADGCPDDDDEDRLVNDEDQCVDSPEDHDGFEDDDGCPDYDNDADGIADGEDKCADKGEDYDLHEDDDGCPDIDNDEDGIADGSDLCPGEPEDGRGSTPKDGCRMLRNELYAAEVFPRAGHFMVMANYHMMKFDTGNYGAIAPGISGYWGWGTAGLSMGVGPKESFMGDLFLGIQPLRWPRHERTGYALFNLTVGGHATTALVFDNEDGNIGAGLWGRLNAKLGGVVTGLEYRGFQSVPSSNLSGRRTIWTVFVGYDFDGPQEKAVKGVAE